MGRLGDTGGRRSGQPLGRLGDTGCVAQEEECREEVLVKPSKAACDDRESLFCLAPVPFSRSCRAHL